MNGAVQGRTALILYGTETGTAQDLAEELGRTTERLRFSTRISELDDVPVNILPSYTITIFVISTTGQGEFPANARSFWTNLLKKKLPATLLQDLPFFLVGLGDTSYPKFNWAARKLGKRLQQLGAVEVIDSCEADEQGEESTDGAFLAWLPLFKAALLADFPIPDGLQPIPDEQALPSKWILEQIPAIPNGHHSSNQINMSENKVEAKERGHVNDEILIGHPDHDSRPIPHSFPVCLEKNTRVTASSHWQDVRLLTLITNESINYLPGDALSILPKNAPEDVNTLLDLMGWTSIADTPVTFTPTTKSTNLANYPPCPIPYLSPPSSSSSCSRTPFLTLRTLLTSYLDITSIPRRTLFALLSRYSTDSPTQRTRLLEFTQPEYLDEYYDYATRPRRSILEILQEFDSVRIPWWEAANVFPVLRARMFSIASGGMSRRLPKASGGEEGGGTQFELLIAIVKYKTVIKKTRQGVCTRYLANLPPGSTLNVVHRTEGRFFNHKNQKHSSSAKKPLNTTNNKQEKQLNLETRPRILIGAGTGIAPLRAIIQSDEAAATTTTTTKNANSPPPSPPTTLIFGARNHDQDLFFKDEWDAKLASSKHASPAEAEAEAEEPPASFRLITAFSRDQPEKLYVQDRLREHAAWVCEWIVQRGAVVVRCGGAGAMGRGVGRAVGEGLMERGGGRGGGKEEEDVEGGGDAVRGWTREEAESYLETMERQGRFCEETW